MVNDRADDAVDLGEHPFRLKAEGAVLENRFQSHEVEAVGRVAAGIDERRREIDGAAEALGILHLAEGAEFGRCLGLVEGVRTAAGVAGRAASGGVVRSEVAEVVGGSPRAITASLLVIHQQVRQPRRKGIAADVADVGRELRIAHRRIVEAAGFESAVRPVGPFVFAVVRGHDADSPKRDERQKRQRPFQERQVAKSAHRVHAERLQVLAGANRARGTAVASCSR